MLIVYLVTSACRYCYEHSTCLFPYCYLYLGSSQFPLEPFPFFPENDHFARILQVIHSSQLWAFPSQHRCYLIVLFDTAAIRMRRGICELVEEVYTMKRRQLW